MKMKFFGFILNFLMLQGVWRSGGSGRLQAVKWDGGGLPASKRKPQLLAGPAQGLGRGRKLQADSVRVHYRHEALLIAPVIREVSTKALSQCSSFVP